jgi:GNAT superfamily N-acetyltransferase
VSTRPAGPDDAVILSALVADYLLEKHPGHRGTTADELRRDVLGRPDGHRILLAERGDRVVGFIAWDAVYDLHWAAHGAQVADLYVAPPERARGVAVALLTGLCAEARRHGATFLRGSAYNRASRTGRFYERIAVGADSAECHCSGRAFRQLADLHGRPIRDIVRSLPPREWNLEP